MDALKRENEILRRALAQYTQASNPAALVSLALPPHNPSANPAPPPRQQLPGGAGPQLPNANGNAQGADDQHPILSVNAPDAPGSGSGTAAAGASAGAGAGAGAAPNSVRALQERARELREEGARIEKSQLGARKRRRAAGAAEGRFDLDEEEDVPALAATAVATNGKRKRPRAAQDAS